MEWTLGVDRWTFPKFAKGGRRRANENNGRRLIDEVFLMSAAKWSRLSEIGCLLMSTWAEWSGGGS